ncbi:MAG TPA: DNA recombination protein RmuC [Thermodesulfobacteriota bacterium]
MEAAVLIMLSVIALGLLALIIMSSRGTRGAPDLRGEIDSFKSEVQSSLSASVRHINSQLASVTGQVAEQLSSVTAQINSSTGQINTRMDNAQRAVGEVRHALGELSKATEQVYEVGKSISGLEKILAAPKARGGLGELLLEDLLSECLPRARYSLQYGFSDGGRVDAVIELKEGLVPIDSKFPLENFRRLVEAATDDERRIAARRLSADCRKHVDAIAASYIRPTERTLSFALMYLPSEGVYYELITRADESGATLSEYALSKRVVPVSPNSFYAYLQTIVMGLKGMEIEERAGEILAYLTSLRGEFEKFASDLDTLGRHISFAKSKYDEVERKARQLGDRLEAGAGVECKEKEPEPG